MGEAELEMETGRLIIHAVLFFYGDAANEALSRQVAKDVADHWNGAEGMVIIGRKKFDLYFDIKGIWAPEIIPEMIFENTDPRNNYFRIEEFVMGNISFVDGINSNTGYFKLENLVGNSTTAAHEFGHTLGLLHPENLDIRGRGTPGIMYPRGTLVDPVFQYDENVPAGLKGGTLNPINRKVLQADIELLRLHRLSFRDNFAMVGDFSSVWHPKHEPE